MPTLSEIRQQYPQYNDLSDRELADGIYRKFYSDLPRDQFDAKIGFQQPSVVESMARGGVQGLTLDFGDELAGLKAANVSDRSPMSAAANMVPIPGMPFSVGQIEALGRMGYEALTGKGGEATKAYTEARDADRAANKVASEANPVAYKGAELAGSILPAAGIPFASLGAAAPLMTNIGRGALGGAIGGGIQGAGTSRTAEDAPHDALVSALIGAGVGGALPVGGFAARALAAPLRATPERQALVDALRQEGVEPTAGQAVGSKALRWLEGTAGDLPFSGGAATAMMERQGRQFTGAALRRTGSTDDLATPQVMADAANRIGQQFEQLSARNTLHFDQQFGNDVGRVLNEYDAVLPSQQRNIVANVVNDIVGHIRTGMPGPVYQETRSRLTRIAQGLRQTDPMLSMTLRGVRDALDDAMTRSISPADAAAWQQARSQWAALRTIEKAVSGAGEGTAQGVISPSQLRNAIVARDRVGYVRGRGDLSELARAGEAVLKPLPNSGTAPRSYYQSLFMPVAAAAGTATAGPAGLAAALAGPAAGRALLSRPAQAWLSGRLANPQPNAVRREIARLLALGPARQLAVSAHQRDQ